MAVEIKSSSERKCTNIPALVFAIVFISITVILVSYCGVVAYKSGSFASIYFGDLTDSCGNVCGQNNSNKDLTCGDPNKTNYPKLIVKFENNTDNVKSLNYDLNYFSEEGILILNECIDKCPHGYYEDNNICTEFNVPQNINTLKICWYQIIVISVVALVFSYIFLILFRHAALYTIWFIIIALVALLIGLTVFCAVYGAIGSAILYGIGALVIVILLICLRKRIVLIAKLFKETSKALIDVPSIMFEPILTLISLVISFWIYATFAVIISFAGKDEPLVPPAQLCNLISFIFITQFIIGCQNFIIAGTVCRWYFTRDKTKLRKPVRKSFSHLFKFHLGSVCLGAILITIVKIIKGIIAYFKNSAKNSRNPARYIVAIFCMCLFEMIEKFLSFLVRNAYIIIALEGTEFCESGRQAFRLIMDNVNDVILLNNIGDFVLVICRLLITTIAGFVGYSFLNQKTLNDDDNFLLMFFGCILAFLIAHCFIMVFEMTVDTIFISFCIDLEENDGQTKPYYMSESLKNIISEMKEKSGGTLVLGPRRDPGIENRLYENNEVPMVQPVSPFYSQDDCASPSQQPQTQQPQPQHLFMPSTTNPYQNF